MRSTSIIKIALIMLVLDGIYIYLNGSLFSSQILAVQGSALKVRLFPTILTYIFLVYGLNYFIISRNRSIRDAFILGVVIYSVYEFTNLALLRKWRASTAIMDTLWGGILFALTTYLYRKI